MKKMISLFLVLAAAAMVLTACGSNNGNQQPSTTANENATQQIQGQDQETQETEEADKFAFVYKDIVMEVKSDAAPALEALGEWKSCTEETSCAFDGLDKNFTYTSFIISTYPDGETDRINSITLLDDTVNTVDGISIGDPSSKVEETYGSEAYNGVNAYILEEGEKRLTVIIDADKVSSIQYTAVFE